MAAEKHASLLSNPVAVHLGLEDPNGPSVVLKQAMEAAGSSRECAILVSVHQQKCKKGATACKALPDSPLDTSLARIGAVLYQVVGNPSNLAGRLEDTAFGCRRLQPSPRWRALQPSGKHLVSSCKTWWT